MGSHENVLAQNASRASSYNPSIYQISNPERTVILPKMSGAARRRVDRASAEFTGRRCLIEDAAESNCVEYVHCLPRHTNGILLDKLEFAWKMDRFTLNVDTHQNIIRLSTKFDIAYDAKKWLLLPETSIIDAYHNVRYADTFPDINDKVYKYTLVAHQNMWDIPIHRQRQPAPKYPSRPSAEDFTYYPHPYSDFPVITSHVHPRFVICNSGAKIQDVSLWHGEPEALQKVADIWNAWRSLTPKGDFLQMTFTHDNPELKDDDSHATHPRRVLPSTLPQGKVSKAQQWHDLRSAKRRKLTHNGPRLTRRALNIFTHDTTSHHSHTSLKNQSILDWLDGVSDLEHSEHESSAAMEVVDSSN